MKTVTERGPAKGGTSSKACPVRANNPIAIKILIQIVLRLIRVHIFFEGSGDPGGPPRDPSISGVPRKSDQIVGHLQKRVQVVGLLQSF